MSKNETTNIRTQIIPEETWMIQEARTIGLNFLHTTSDEGENDSVIYVFIHYKDGEFSFDARPKSGLVFAVQDERDTIDKFFAVLNKKLLELDSNNVF